jgi:sigma-54 dependent transcriptional regulator, acetoin dehydrogenase operon transcriptional activator AcoR
MTDEIENHAVYVKLTVSSVLGQTLADPISRSWRRCIHDYALDPANSPDIAVLNGAELRNYREELANVLAISNSEVRNLYEQIAGSGFGVMIADRHGVIIDYVSDPDLKDSFAELGLCNGGIWDERSQGTNAIGTCLLEKEPIVVHQKDHFLPRNLPLTGSAAPIYDQHGEVVAVLSAAARYELAQRHTLALVNTSARTIENRLFLDSFKEETIVRFHNRSEFIGAVREGEIAISRDGAILGVTRNGLSQLGYKADREILGKHFDEIFHGTYKNLLERNLDRAGSVVPIYAAKSRQRYFAAVRLPEPTTASEQTSTGRVKRRETLAHQDSVTREILLDELALGDPRMALNVRYVKTLRDRDIPILIQGETGTGKEVMARAIHASRDGDHRPFVAVNCAAIPESLIESELFGYTPGAFTGASRDGQKGKILQADKGTLFLDEIGDMPLQLQTRLLRVLEEREVYPLGSGKSIKVDIALMSATHRDLTEFVAAGRFRSDLFYRLQGLMLSLPPLRERLDKRRLIEHMIELERQRHVGSGGRGNPSMGVDGDALRLLEEYSWPGNIRQLRTVIRVTLAICSGGRITLDVLPEEIRTRSDHTKLALPKDVTRTPRANLLAEINGVNEDSYEERLEGLSSAEEAERDALLRVLERHRWNVAAVARHLSVSRLTIYRKLKRFGIQK